MKILEFLRGLFVPRTKEEHCDPVCTILVITQGEHWFRHFLRQKVKNKGGFLQYRYVSHEDILKSYRFTTPVVVYISDDGFVPPEVDKLVKLAVWRGHSLMYVR